MDPLQQTLGDLAAFLDQRGAPFALIGGLAVAVHGEARFTVDVDAVLAVTIEEATALLADLGASPFEPLFPGVKEVLRAAFILPLRHRATGTTVDLAIGLTGFEQHAIERAAVATLLGVPVPVVTAEDLLVMKVLAGRPRDVEDAGQIARRQGAKLDRAYVLETGRLVGEAVGEDLTRRLEALLDAR